MLNFLLTPPSQAVDHIATITDSELRQIWYDVPVNYYQSGVERNVLQRIWHLGKLQTVLALIGNKTPDNILDVGCASGWFLYQLKKRYPKSACTGIDPYKKAIAYGKKYYKNKLSLQVADGHKLPFRSNSFDVIVCAEVLEHVVDPKKVLLEIKRVLKPDGVAIIEMDTGNVLFSVIWYFWTHVRNGVWKDAHIQVFNKKRLEDLIINTGWIIKKARVFNFTMAVCYVLKKSG